MDGQIIRKILIIENNAKDLNHIRNSFTELEKLSLFTQKQSFNLLTADSINSGFECVKKEPVDIIILDAALHSGQSFCELTAKFYGIPLVLFINQENEPLAIKAITNGTYDYLVKENLNASILARSIRYVSERKKLLDELKSSSLFDSLTGLFNRQGFLLLAQQQFRLVQRMGTGLFLLYADFKGLTAINSNLGFNEGNNALIETANILKKTFRDSDIISRIEGDEFAVLGIETMRVRAEILTGRLEDNIKASNAKLEKFKVTLDVVVARYETESPSTIEDFLSKAHKLLQNHRKS